jgi:hypothetical protein
MEAEWVNRILPILNAAGIPLLSIGIIVLIWAYRKSSDVYRGTTNYLLEENKRLKDQLQIIDSDYLERLGKLRDMLAKAENAISELQARKVGLLAKPENSPKEAILSDVEKINDVILSLRELEGTTWRMKIEYFERTRYLEEFMKKKEDEINRLVDQIGDVESKVIVIRVLTTDEVYEKHKLNELGSGRGLSASSQAESKERLPP